MVGDNTDAACLVCARARPWSKLVQPGYYTYTHIDMILNS